MGFLLFIHGKSQGCINGLLALLYSLVKIQYAEDPVK